MDTTIAIDLHLRDIAAENFWDRNERPRTVPFDERFATVMRYADDPEYRAAMDAEREAEQARLNAIITANIARHRAARERAVLASVGSGE